jgi:hypothetical protein
MNLPDADSLAETLRERSILNDLNAISLKLGMNALLIGAAARLQVFDRPYGILGRLTKDLDFAVRSSNWEDFEQFTKAMISGDSQLFLKTSIPHHSTPFHSYSHRQDGRHYSLWNLSFAQPNHQLARWKPNERPRRGSMEIGTNHRTSHQRR